MISLTINNVPTLFIKAFKAEDVQAILKFVRNCADNYGGASNRVLFIDTPITPATVEAVEKLTREKFRVVFRDHHGILGEPRNDREKQVFNATAKLRNLLGDDCFITVRSEHPACSTLVETGEFEDAVAIIADPDADGLTAAMKAAGVCYPGLDEDAAKLDGEPQLQVTGTPISQLLAKALAVIPSYNVQKPREREIALQRTFSDWYKAVAGDKSAEKRLEEKVADYEEAVGVSKSLSLTATEVTPGVVLVDVSEAPLYDPATLTSMLELDPHCCIVVLRKSLGPIAALHGIQYSLSVSKSHQDRINLQKLVPDTVKSDPEVGVIANVSFLLHVSEHIWNTQLLGLLTSQSWLDCSAVSNSVQD